MSNLSVAGIEAGQNVSRTGGPSGHLLTPNGGFGRAVLAILACLPLSASANPSLISANPDDFDVQKYSDVASRASAEAQRVANETQLVQDRFARSSREADILQDQQNRTLRELQATQGQLDAAIARKAQVQQQMPALNAESAQNAQQIEKVNAQLANEAAQKPKLKGELDQAIARQRSVDQDTTSKQDRLDYLKRLLVARANSLKQAEDAVKLHQGRVAAAEADGAAATREKQAADREKATLQAQRDAATDDAARAAIDAKLATVDARIEALAKRIDQAEGTAHFARRDVEHAQLTAQGERDQLAREKADIASAEAELNAIRAEIAKAKAEVDRARAAVASSDQRTTAMSQQQSQLIRRRDEIARQFAALEAESRRVDQQIPMLQQRLPGLRAEVAQRQRPLEHALNRARADQLELDRALRNQDQFVRYADDTRRHLEHVEANLRHGIEVADRYGRELATPAARQAATNELGRRSSVQSSVFAALSDALAKESYHGAHGLPVALRSATDAGTALTSERRRLNVRYPNTQIQAQFENSFAGAFANEYALASTDVMHRLIRGAGSTADVKSICARGVCAATSAELGTGGTTRYTIAVGAVAGVSRDNRGLEVRVIQVSPGLQIVGGPSSYALASSTSSSIAIDAAVVETRSNGRNPRGTPAPTAPSLVRLDVLGDAGVIGSLDLVF